MCKLSINNMLWLALFFLTISVLKRTRFSGNSKPIMDIYLQILDENWLDHT